MEVNRKLTSCTRPAAPPVTLVMDETPTPMIEGELPSVADDPGVATFPSVAEDALVVSTPSSPFALVLASPSVTVAESVPQYAILTSALDLLPS